MQRLTQNGEFWLHPVAVALLHLFILAAFFVIIPIEELFLKKITAGKLLICINAGNDGPHCSNTDHQSMSTMDRL